VADRKWRKVEVNISRTRAERAHAQGTYKTTNRNLKTNIKADKRNYIEALAVEAEEAFLYGNMKDLYNTTKKLPWTFSKSERPVMDKEGMIMQGKEG
jgi:outer membrane protein assembly factor BamA